MKDYKKMTDKELLKEYHDNLNDIVLAGLAAGELLARGWNEVEVNGKDKMVKVKKDEKAA